MGISTLIGSNGWNLNHLKGVVVDMIGNSFVVVVLNIRKNFMYVDAWSCTF
jgi:hypothetical protein